MRSVNTMDDEQKYILCCGCLIAERKMHEINEDSMKQCFYQIINEIATNLENPESVSLCWECEAQLRNFIKFKRKVQNSYKSLSEHIIQDSDDIKLQPKPKLSKSTITDITKYVYHVDKNDVQDVTYEINEEVEKNRNIVETNSKKTAKKVVKLTLTGKTSENRETCADKSTDFVIINFEKTSNIKVITMKSLENITSKSNAVASNNPNIGDSKSLKTVNKKRNTNLNNMKSDINTVGVNNDIIVNENSDKTSNEIWNEENISNKNIENKKLTDYIIYQEDDLDDTTSAHEEFNTQSLTTENVCEEQDSYECDKCSIKFKNNVELNNHVCLSLDHVTKNVKEYMYDKRKRRKRRAIMDSYKDIKLCREHIEEEIRLAMLRDDYVNAMFKCEKCFTSFGNAKDLKDHIITKHGLYSTKFTCNICEHSFATEKALNGHMSKHTRCYQCSICSARCGSLEGFSIHNETCQGSVYATSSEVEKCASASESPPRLLRESRPKMYKCRDKVKASKRSKMWIYRGFTKNLMVRLMDVTKDPDARKYLLRSTSPPIDNKDIKNEDAPMSMEEEVTCIEDASSSTVNEEVSTEMAPVQGQSERSGRSSRQVARGDKQSSCLI